MKRIIMFVEGVGELKAVPKLVGRLISEMNAWNSVQVDESPFLVGQIGKLLKNDCAEWKKKINACLRRRDLGGILLLLDGDIKRADGGDFCAATIAKKLALVARPLGAGSTFSVAVVFACMEYESWLLAGAESFAGKSLSDGRLISTDLKSPAGNLEESPRDAKGWLNHLIEGGYLPIRDQAELTKMLDLELVRERQLRSFRRLESAVAQLVDAIRNNAPVASPL